MIVYCYFKIFCFILVVYILEVLIVWWESFGGVGYYY